jgi:hypothetical protein
MKVQVYINGFGRNPAFEYDTPNQSAADLLAYRFIREGVPATLPDGTQLIYPPSRLYEIRILPS